MNLMQSYHFWLEWMVILLSSRGMAQPPFPLPLLPIPSASQLSWQSQLAMFFHFGMNTFTDSEWGSGTADPSVFYPTDLDARQWIRVAKSLGFSRVVLTAKHHDGFCLWPSAYTNYSVRSSKWRSGRGDVVGELAKAAEEEGIKLGLYLSPWDRHESSYGQTLEYNKFYLAQLRELLTMYGPVAEVWLDGAKGKDAADMEYLFQEWFSVIHQLQPEAVIFSDGGPDVRWVGDEGGEASSTCWSTVNRTSITIGNVDTEYLKNGDPKGIDWVPPECDVSVRPSWFWHSKEHPKDALSLLDIFYTSVGSNCGLLLNVPPNTSGLLPEEDIQVLTQFKFIRDSIFSINLAQNANVTADTTLGDDSYSPFAPSKILNEDMFSYWAPEDSQTRGSLQVDMGMEVMFNVIRVQEAISMGQRVIRHHIDVFKDGTWHTVCNGTTIGYKRLHRIEPVRAQIVNFVIEEAKASPLIASFGIYFDTFSAKYMMLKLKKEVI